MANPMGKNFGNNSRGQEIASDVQELKDRGLFRTFRVVSGPQGPEIIIDGKKVLLMCSNDYLGLANHPELRDAALKAIEKYGVGAGSSRLISGNMELHIMLEERIAAFKGTESALLFNSGYHANTGIIPAMVGRGDIIFSDELNHASIIDGCRLSFAETVVYPHRNMNFLEDALKKSVYRRKLIVTDAVFSMDGDIAPLPEIIKLGERYNAFIMVDEAHSTGVLGERGRGVREFFGIDNDIDILMGTLGKALGCFGAYAAVSRQMRDYLTNRARSFIFTTALPPAICASAIRAMDIIENNPAIVKRLHKNIECLSNGLRSVGISYISEQNIPVYPIIIGDAQKTMTICGHLFDEGVFIQGIRPPTVPEGTSRLRLTVTAGHTGEHISRCLRVVLLAMEKEFFNGKKINRKVPQGY